MPKQMTIQEQDNYNSEVALAGKRVGKISEDIMLWLLRFAALDLDTLSRGDDWNLHYELLYLYHQKGTTDVVSSLIKEFYRFRPDEIRSLQQTAKKVLDQTLYDEASVDEITISQGPPTLQFALVKNPQDKDKLLYVITAQDAKVRIVDLIFRIFAEHGPRLRICPECQLIFLADTKKRLFCSTRCQTRVASRKYVGIPADRKGKRGRPRKEATPLKPKSHTKGGKRDGKKK